jgi:hypothetical protein
MVRFRGTRPKNGTKKQIANSKEIEKISGGFTFENMLRITKQTFRFTLGLGDFL